MRSGLSLVYDLGHCALSDVSDNYSNLGSRTQIWKALLKELAFSLPSFRGVSLVASRGLQCSTSSLVGQPYDFHAFTSLFTPLSEGLVAYDGSRRLACCQW